MKRPKASSRESAESLAVQALTYVGSDPERLGRFLSLSGIGPQSLRVAAGQPGFLAGVLEHVANDEALLIAFAADQGIAPEEVDRARRVLAGGDRERESP
jgi:Protein of unknown function (DUF3572)